MLFHTTGSTMTTRILIMGLPGAGKTYFAERLQQQLGIESCDWFNADAVRKQFDDWDFTPEGRIRQSRRMRELADASPKQYVICDFVAPLPEMRDNFAADYTIWIDSIESGRFEDTNRAFVAPTEYDLRVTEQNAEKWIPTVIEQLTATKQFDWKRPTTQMLGRWQPWHDGHTALFKKALLETGQVCIMIRDVGGIVGADAGAGRTAAQTDNPFDYDTVVENITQGLAAAGFNYGEEYIIMSVPNIVDISYGRGVGYTFTQHDLGEEIHNISATKIRAQLRAEGKL